MLILDSLIIGEIGEKNVQVRESLTSFSYDLTADMVSEIRFTVYDPKFAMHNSNYFMVGRTVTCMNQTFEIAAVATNHGAIDECDITARLQATQKMRRDKGARSFGAVAPSQVAAIVAAEVGLKIFAEDSVVNGEVLRESSENQDESTFDMLTRIANAIEYRFFEANGTLYFASEKFLIENQAAFTINIPSNPTDAFYAVKASLRRTADGKSAATAQISLLQNDSALSIYPGASFIVKGVSHFTNKFMVDKVGIEVGPSALVSISGTDITESPDMGCSTQTFAYGATGACVQRIQMAVGVTADGIWGPITQQAVINFQNSKGLPADGVVTPTVWQAIGGN